MHLALGNEDLAFGLAYYNSSFEFSSAGNADYALGGIAQNAANALWLQGDYEAAALLYFSGKISFENAKIKYDFAIGTAEAATVSFDAAESHYEDGTP